MQSTEVIEVIVPEPPMGCSLALSDRGALCTVEAVQPASRAAGAACARACVEIKFYGAFVLILRVNIHAIDAP